MELRDKRHRHAQVEAGALSDILFFLLIFFLITSTMANPNVIKLMRPKSSSVAKDPKKPDAIVSINSEHQVYVNRNPIAMAALQDELAKEIAGKEDPIILLNVANEVTAEEIVKVMEIAQYKLKAKISLATDKPKE
jgi:biopolymer transport protein ExbD